MSIITISRGTFSGGEKLAESLAEKLGYRSLSREILVKAAEKYGISEEKLYSAVTSKISMKEWLAIDIDRFRYLSFIQSALCEEAKKDNIIYHGHTGHLLLKGISHVLKIKVTASMEQRVIFAMERNKLTREQAINYIEAVDGQREKWTKFLYDVDWNDLSLYDIVINLEQITIQDACDMIGIAIQMPAFQADEASRKSMENLTIGSRVKAALAYDESTKDLNVEVSADNGSITLEGKVKNMEDTDNIEKVAKSVPGIKKVICNCRPLYIN